MIVFSADATPGQIARLHEAGAYSYLTKPFKVSALLALVDEVLQAANPAGADFMQVPAESMGADVQQRLR